jgi:hypothetical protein
MDHPVTVLLRNGLPEIDFVVASHGFAKDGRDYLFILRDAGGQHAEAFELTLTDVEGLTLRPRSAQPNPPIAGDEPATWFDGAAAQPVEVAASWSVAYPGVSIPGPDTDPWWLQTGRPLHAVAVQTERMLISMVFSEAKLRPLGPIEQGLVALQGPA